MTTAVHDRRPTRGRGSGRRLAGRDLAAGFPATLAVAMITRRFFDLPASYLLHAVIMYMLLAGLTLWRRDIGQLARPGQVLGTPAIGKEAVVADAVEARGQDVDEEAAQELGCFEGHGLVSLAAF